VVLREGVAQRSLQTSPHLVLLDPVFYHERLKRLIAEWVLLYMRSKTHVAHAVEDKTILDYMVYGPFGDKAVTALIKEHNNVEQKKMINLAHDWVHSFAPHVLSKINRVSYGLLTKEDMALGNDTLNRFHWSV
jgi:hypothetical protein